jgi:hypothetical protein
MKLIATWLSSQEPACDAPHSVMWGDGHAATMGEFWEHCEDTRLCIVTDGGGLEWHFFPDVIAEVFYCPRGRVWGVRGDGVEPASLYVTDPDATDAEIHWALGALPIWYRARIVRQPGLSPGRD